MKRLFAMAVLASAVLLTSSCKKTSTETLYEMVDTSAMLLYKGDFTGLNGETVTGMAKIYLQNSQYYLALENFSTSNGPDLKVYLSQGPTPQNFIKLGDLKSTNGNQVYPILGSPDFKQYKYALIHCERFNHLYGRAELK